MKNIFLQLLIISFLSLQYTFLGELDSKNSIQTLNFLEFEVGEKGLENSIVLGKAGFMVHGYENNKKGEKWEFLVYNTEFELVKSFNLPASKTLVFIDHYLTEDHKKLYMLFRYKGAKKSDADFILVYDIEKQKTKTYNFKMSMLTADHYEFVILGNNAFVRVRHLGDQRLIKMDLSAPKIIPEMFEVGKKKDPIRNIQIMPGEKEMYVLFSKEHKNIKGRFKDYIQIIGLDGTVKEEPVLLDFGKEYSILSCYFFKDSDQTIIYGKYSNNTKSEGVRSGGIYIANLHSNSISDVVFHDFENISDLGDNLLPNKTAKVSDMRSLKILFHDIRKVEDKILLVGEFYEETYYITNGDQYHFNGYQYKCGIALELTSDFDFVDGYSFPMHLEKKPFKLNRKVNVSIKENEKTFAYTNHNTFVKISEKNKGKLEKTSQTIIPDGNKVKVKNFESDTEHWYDSYFLLHGKYKGKGDGKNRNVFVFKLLVE